jgi:hypothetical protein
VYRGGGETEAGKHPPPAYSEVYVAVEGSEVCLSLNPPNAFCARDGVARETRLELAFSQYKTKIREVFSRRDCWHLPRRRENT